MSINSKMTAIADAIREKTGGTELLSLDGMTTAIPDVYDAGITAGRKCVYDDFWDEYQNYGKRRDYRKAFSGYFWTDETFKPKYDFDFGWSETSTWSHMFSQSKITDLTTALEKAGVRIASLCPRANERICEGSAITRFPEINWKSDNSYYYGTIDRVFCEAQNLETIDKIKLSETGNQVFEVPFYNCKSLKNIVFEGKIGRNFPINHSPLLTTETCKSIINALVDYSGTDKTYVLTLHADAKSRLTENDIGTITQKGWTLA